MALKREKTVRAGSCLALRVGPLNGKGAAQRTFEYECGFWTPYFIGSRKKCYMFKRLFFFFFVRRETKSATLSFIANRGFCHLAFVLNSITMLLTPLIKCRHFAVARCNKVKLASGYMIRSSPSTDVLISDKMRSTAIMSGASRETNKQKNRWTKKMMVTKWWKIFEIIQFYNRKIIVGVTPKSFETFSLLGV